MTFRKAGLFEALQVMVGFRSSTPVQNVRTWCWSVVDMTIIALLVIGGTAAATAPQGTRVILQLILVMLYMWVTTDCMLEFRSGSMSAPYITTWTLFPLHATDLGL